MLLLFTYWGISSRASLLETLAQGGQWKGRGDCWLFASRALCLAGQQADEMHLTWLLLFNFLCLTNLRLSWKPAAALWDKALIEIYLRIKKELQFPEGKAGGSGMVILL